MARQQGSGTAGWYVAFTEDSQRWYAGPFPSTEVADRAAFLELLGKRRVSYSGRPPKAGRRLPHVALIEYVREQIRKAGHKPPSEGGYDYLKSYRRQGSTPNGTLGAVRANLTSAFGSVFGGVSPRKNPRPRRGELVVAGPEYRYYKIHYYGQSRSQYVVWDDLSNRIVFGPATLHDAQNWVIHQGIHSVGGTAFGSMFARRRG